MSPGCLLTQGYRERDLTRTKPNFRKGQEKVNLPPMAATTAVAVRRLSAAGEVRSALALLARGAKAGDTTLDVAACTALVHGYCRSGDVAEAQRVFDREGLGLV